MSRSVRLAVLGGFVVVAVVGFLVARPDGGPSPPAATTSPTTGSTTVSRPPPPVPVIRVRDGSPVGGVKRIAARRGDTIRFRVASNVATEAHLHGYDLEKHVAPGGTATFSFRATIEGSFEVELHPQHEVVARVVVTP